MALDLVGRVVICCKICSIWDLAGFHFLVPELYANLVLVHDLIETVLICWYSAQFRILQDFTSWCEGCARALWHIVLFNLGLNVAVKFHNLVIVTSIILWNMSLFNPQHGLLMTKSRDPNWVLSARAS